jgi:predicted Abi (CAAX) family protease
MVRQTGWMLRRLLVSLQTAPTKRDWSEMALGALAFMGLALIPGRALFELQVMPIAAWPTMALTALMVPALLEEGVFRGTMVPARSEARAAVLAIGLSTVLFMGWHVLEAMTFLPGARTVFLRPDFLFLAGALGLICAVLRWRSGSLWTAVTLHWMVVVAWKGLLGGPALADLTS